MYIEYFVIFVKRVTVAAKRDRKEIQSEIERKERKFKRDKR